MKYLFIANPIAGKGRTKKLLVDIKNYLEHNNINYKLIETSKKGNIPELIEKHIDHFDKIVVVGGDGTVHELINSKRIENKILGVLPTGSGNDFALTLGFKNNLLKDLSTILDKKTSTLDIGFAEVTEFSGNKFSFYFANSLGIGFDAEVADSVKVIKYLRGLFLYLFGVFKTLIKYEYRTLYIKTNLVELNEPIFMVSIGNGKTAGGGFKLTPLANPIDNLLDICIVKKISKLKVLQILPLAIIGKHINHPAVKYLKTKEVYMSSNKPIYIHADGEIKTDQMKFLRVTILKQYASFITDGIAYANEKTGTQAI